MKFKLHLDEFLQQLLQESDEQGEQDQPPFAKNEAILHIGIIRIK